MDTIAAQPVSRDSLPSISKSRFLLGSQCHRLLWWTAHEPDAEELATDAAAEMIFTQGHLVGEEARRRFPGGVNVDSPEISYKDIDGRLARTQELIDSGASVIFEAAFKHQGVFVAVDVLVRTATGWEFIEVKSSTKVKPEHILDVAVQRFVLEGAGLHVERVMLWHLDRACMFPDLSNLFCAVDLTEAASELADVVRADARAMRRMLAGELPAVEPGEHCSAPRDCPFMDRCHEEVPEHHVSTLYRIGAKASALEARGIRTVRDVPSSEKLSATAERQVRAVKQGRIVVEPELARALARLTAPGLTLAFFDLETVGFAIPRYAGTSPWDSVPVQASVHTLGGDRITTRAHLASFEPTEAPADPRPALAQFIVDALADADVVVAYNASFERRCLEALAEMCPALREEIEAIIQKLEDLLPIVRNHVYHPDFCGSFSLKSVVPALVPELSYASLGIDDADAHGMAANAALFRLATESLSPDEAAALRRELLAYCALDTEGLMKVFLALRGMMPTARARRAAAR